MRKRSRGPETPQPASPSPLSPPPAAEQRMPIEELSQRTGVTVRNLRELQTRGLLAPPELEGRKGFYSAQHLARVLVVRRLQDRGYSLAAIVDLLRTWEGKLGALAVLQLEQTLATPSGGAQRTMHEAELVALFPELRGDPRLVEAAKRAQLVFEHDGALMAPSAELVELARAFADAGVPPEAILAELEGLREDAERMAVRVRGLFQRHVVAALQRAGLPAEALKQLAESAAQLRPAAVRVVTILFAQTLDRAGPYEVRSAPPVQPTASPTDAG